MSSFDERAATWDDDPGHWERARAVARAIRDRLDLSGSPRTLDYGAGTGMLARSLADDLGEVTLADASAGMTEAAEAFARTATPGKFTALRLDLLSDPPPAHRYDLVISLLALHHVPDVDTLLRRLHDVLEPGGRIALCDLDQEDGSFHSGHGHVDVHHGFDRDHLARQATGAGFADVAFSTAASLTKEVGGVEREYPLFLLTATRPRESVDR